MSDSATDNFWSGNSADSAALWGAESGDYTTSVTTLLDSEVPETADTSDHQPKGKRIRKGDLEKLLEDRQNDEEKFVSVWYRAARNKPLQLFMDKLPRNAAMAFSPVWKKQIEDGGSSAVLIIEDDYLSPYKLLFHWINECIDNGNDVKFPEIEDDNAINTLFDVLVVANQLQIPEMSLQEHLKKRAIKYARKSLISIEYVESVFDENNPMYTGPSPALEEAVCASIFEAWWSRTLDEPDYDEYAACIKELRDLYPRLDKGLNESFDSKKAFIEQKKAERKGQKGQRAGAKDNGRTAYENEGIYEGVSDNANGSGPYNDNGADGGWGDAAGDAGDVVEAVAEWGITDTAGW